eukprot:2568479-Ditylum_brightwellii.AAC.1
MSTSPLMTKTSLSSDYLTTSSCIHKKNSDFSRAAAVSNSSEKEKEDTNTPQTTTTNNNNNNNNNSNGKDKDYSYWRVFTTANKLEQNGIRLSNKMISNNDDYEEKTHQITKQVVKILRYLGNKYAGNKEWAGVLNKSTLLDEIEESIVMLTLLIEWLDGEGEEEPLTIVDVCCGKGVFSLLASYIFSTNTEYFDNNRNRGVGVTKVRSIVLLDKADICWGHIDAANKESTGMEEEHSYNNKNGKLYERPIMTAWADCNLHETDTLLARMQQEIQGK